MRTHARLLAAGVVSLALGLVLLFVSNPISAADEDDEAAEAAKKTVNKVVEAMDKDPAAAAKMAQDIAAGLDSETDIMNLMKKRLKSGKGGWGVGPEATGASDDGIEAKIRNISRKPPTPPQLAKEQKDLVEMAKRTAAIGEIAKHLGPKMKMGDRDPKDWVEYSEAMAKHAKDLAKAIEGKDRDKIKDIAAELNASCNNCHGKFRCN